ncbi:MAG: hypothetical protein H6722_09605 [Sandaracinus sp.]|nr:hypothetical protein [Sandaracinus sp.]
MSACFASTATAQELPLELSWEAPWGCPSEAEVREDLRRAMVVRPGVVLQTLQARGTIVEARGRFVLRLETRLGGARGRREVHAQACHDLVRAATLVLALAFGEGVELREEEPTPTSRPPPPLPQTTAPPVSTPPDSTPPVSTPSTWRLGFALGGGIDAGISPRAAPFGSLALDLVGDHLRLRSSVATSNEQTVSLEPAHARFRVLSLGLVACLTSQPARLRVEGCADLRGACVRAAGSGTANDRDATAPLLTVGGQAAVLLSLGAGFALRVAGWAGAIPHRPEFELERVVVHRPEPWNAGASLELSWSAVVREG